MHSASMSVWLQWISRTASLRCEHGLFRGAEGPAGTPSSALILFSEIYESAFKTPFEI
jgi:hypothetical protein